MNNCPVSNSPIELGEMDDKTKCPECGKDTLEEYIEEKRSHILRKFKTPLVAGIIGGSSLLGGYYCFSGDSVCFTDSNASQKTTISEPPIILTEKNETTIIPIITKPKEIDSKTKLEKEKREAIQKMNTKWELIKDSNDIEKLKAFKIQYPDSKYTSDINLKVKKLQEKVDKDKRTEKINHEWNIVKKTTDIELLREFNRKYPNSPYYPTIEIKIDNIKRDKEAKERAKQAQIKRDKEEAKERAKQAQIQRDKEANRKFSLTVKRTPSYARVKITNIKPTYHDGIKLKRGRYNIEISAKGYKTKSFSLKIGNRNLITRNYKLDKKPIHIQESTMESPAMETVIIRPRPTPLTPRPTPVSECTKQLDKIQGYLNHRPPLKTKALQELNIFDSNARNCTHAEQIRAKKFDNLI